MFKSFLLFSLMAVALLLSSQFAFAIPIDEVSQGERELEIQALTFLADGSERRAKRMHRTIERYRVYRERMDAKVAAGRDEKEINLGFSSLRRLINMSNLALSLHPKDRPTVWKITHRTLDLGSYIESQGNATARNADEPYMEEMVVIGSIFDHIPIDPAEFSVHDISLMRYERRDANRLYRDGYYDEAYPLLLDLGKRGFKDAQSRLAYILLNGTEDIQKSNLRALGWLGAAAYGDTEPQFRVLFSKYMKEVPEFVRPTVDTIVQAYQESFAHDEHQNCSTEHWFASGPVKRTYCRFKLETIAEACEAGSGGGRCWAHAVNTQVNL